MINFKYPISVRIREKDKELRAFLESLDESVDVSDVIRTCALIGARQMGGLFPKKLGSEPAFVEPPTRFVEPVQQKPKNLFIEVASEDEEEDMETLGDKLVNRFLK